MRLREESLVRLKVAWMLKAWLAVAKGPRNLAVGTAEAELEGAGWHSIMVQVLAAGFPSGEHSNWAVCQTLLPHTRAALRHVGWLYSLLTVAGISSISPAAKIVPGA
jgi:hypothetical protein